MNQEKFKDLKAKHPEWSDEQIWTAISLEMSADATIDNNKDVEPDDPNIFVEVVNKAREWMKEVIPAIFEKVKEVFTSLLDQVKMWINENLPDILNEIRKWLNRKFAK